MSMDKNRNLAVLYRMSAWAAVLAIVIGVPVLFAQPTPASETVYIRLNGGKMAIEGSAHDTAHAGWINAVSIVAGDLNGDSKADSENIGSQSSGAGAGKVTTASSGAGAGKASTKESNGRDAASGLPTGKRMHKPFVIIREVDKASPLLAKACASGQHFPSAEVEIVENGRAVHYTMTDVLISSVSNEASKAQHAERPMESVSFTYQKIEMTK
ncbi:MAG TPA: type VI secretion system tube protein Hcp [Candidatus Acidoferrales bacterium]|nr:type VI secretion system tube protein Hcp [Candidatus Acidoferrales bacterium]